MQANATVSQFPDGQHGPWHGMRQRFQRRDGARRYEHDPQ
jgi:hypothetical protein